MTQTITTAAPTRLSVPLRDLGVAPENLRCGEPADVGVPRLADTVAAAGLIYPLVVRPGRKGEPPYMVLDGRRRLFAQLLRAERGEITADAPVACVLAEGRVQQAAAAVVTNSEQAPVHTADVISAIGRMRGTRMTTAAIAEALGYELLEVRRLEALARVHPTVLQAYRQGCVNLRQVRLFARLKDRARQEALAQAALDGAFHAYQLESLVQRGRVTAEDPRLRLVGRAAYAEAGGRIESDLFGELPDVVIDPDLLDRLWRERAERLGAFLASAGVRVFIAEDGCYSPPDGYQSLPWIVVSSLAEADRTAWEAARARAEAAGARLEACGETQTDADLSDWLQAQLDLARAKLPGRPDAVAAVVLTPDNAFGLDAAFLQARPAPQPVEADDDESEEGESSDLGRWTSEPPDLHVPEVAVATGAVSNVLHETRSDLATRGLIRALADCPDAALTALIAQLFKLQALSDSVREGESALTVEARRYARPQGASVHALDGAVRRRLEARRADYLASGLRPIAFVESLAPGDRLALLAEVVALSLDLREPRTTSLRRAARAEAAEIAQLCSADITTWWTPDAPFLGVHGKSQLLAMLTAMGVEDPLAARLKKPELVARVAAEAERRRWAPAEVRWVCPSAGEASANGDEGGAGDGAHGAEAPADEGLSAQPSEAA